MQPADDTLSNGVSGRIEELTLQVAALKRDLEQMRTELATVREKCSQAYRAVLAMCCPTEWYTQEIDEKELAEALAHAHERPTIQELIEELKQNVGPTDARPI